MAIIACIHGYSNHSEITVIKIDRSEIKSYTGSCCSTRVYVPPGWRELAIYVAS